MNTPGIAATLAVTTLLAGTGVSSPAAAACTYEYVGDDGPSYPKWSEDCDTTVSPGRFGPLRMGSTTVPKAKQLNYLALNPLCANRLDGVNAGGYRTRKNGKVAAWLAGFRKGATQTTRGLRPRDTFSKARRLYPGLEFTRFVPNPFGGPGQDVYSTQGKNGWLDVYVTRGRFKIDYFSVRATSVSKPVPWIIDGC